MNILQHLCCDYKSQLTFLHQDIEITNYNVHLCLDSEQLVLQCLYCDYNHSKNFLVTFILCL